jgi:hypothetical protein
MEAVEADEQTGVEVDAELQEKQEEEETGGGKPCQYPNLVREKNRINIYRGVLDSKRKKAQIDRKSR